MGIIGSNVRGRFLQIDFNSSTAFIENAQIGSTVLPINPMPWFDGDGFWVANVNGVNIKHYKYHAGAVKFSQRGAISPGSTYVGLYGSDKKLYGITSAGKVDQIDIPSGLAGTPINLPASLYRGLTGDGKRFWTHDVTNGNIVQFNEQGNIQGAFTAPANTYDLHFRTQHNENRIYVNTGIAGVAAVVRSFDANNGSALGGHVYVGTMGASDFVAGICGDEKLLYVCWVDVTPLP